MIFIIHQRKSAGTSLIYTLQKILNHTIIKSNLNLLNRPPNNAIMSSHLSPSPVNVNLVKRYLQNNKLILLIRNPQQSYHAYYRHRTINNEEKKMIRQFSPQVFVYFHDRWLEELSDQPNVLVCRFEDLVSDNHLEITRILNFFDLPYSLDIEFVLEKKRYTGVGLKLLNQNKIEDFDPNQNKNNQLEK